MRLARRLLGRHAVWGEGGILSPASGSSSQWLAYVFSAVPIFSFKGASGSLYRAYGVRPRTTPLLVFISDYVVSLPLLRLSCFVRVGARPLALDAPSGNSPRLKPYVLAPRTYAKRVSAPTRARTKPPAKDVRDRGWGSLISSQQYQFQELIDHF